MPSTRERLGRHLGEERVGDAKAARHLASEVEDEQGVAPGVTAIERLEVARADPEKARVSDRAHGRAARHDVEDRHLAEPVARAEHRDTRWHIALRLLHHLDLAAEQYEHLATA